MPELTNHLNARLDIAEVLALQSDLRCFSQDLWLIWIE